MSINGPMSGITFSGLSSGIDVESIISKLISIESFSITRIQAQQAQLQAKQTIYGQFKTQLLSLNSAASALNLSNTFSASSASSSDESVATVSSTDIAVPGDYELNVTAIATAHKVTSSSQAGAESELGYVGSFVINGKLVTTEASDTLSSIAGKINGSNSGVSATVVKVSETEAYLTLTADETGAESSIQLADQQGSVLNSLGLIGATVGVRNQVDADTIRSANFDSSSATFQSIWGVTGTGSFTVDGNVVNFDYSTDTLQTIAAKINALGGSTTASVTSEEVDGETVYQLELDGPGMPGNLVDTDGFLEEIGVLQRNYANELVAAQNAAFSLDGIAMTRPDNTIADAVTGLSFTLKKVGTSTLSVSRDTGAIKDKIKEFQTAFNDVIDYIRQNSQFDSETFDSGPLFGDQVASQTEAMLNEILFTSTGSGTYKNLTDIGFTLNDEGKLDLDESKLDTAIANSLSDVKQIFTNTATTTSNSITFVSSTSKTNSSPPTGYAVNITQAATKSLATASVAQTLPTASSETLTFDGALFGNTPIDMLIPAGYTQAQIVSLINSDDRFEDLVVASVDGGGMLQIESKRYGEAGRFTVSSETLASADSSGIGNAAVIVDGLDVAGTIGGEAATGNGQFLMGDEDNLNTSGLQIQYEGSATGNIGSIVYTKGLGSIVNLNIESYTDSVNGLMTTIDDSLTAQIDDMDERIATIEERLQAREDYLRQQFAAMEEAMSRLNSQGAQLAAIFAQQG